jgi:hypothetical protein
MEAPQSLESGGRPDHEMTFQGSLKELHLPDVIQLVAVSGKSGCFRLSKDGAEGAIYLESGRIVHAVFGRLSGEEAVYSLATWTEGSFRFVPGEEAPAKTISKSNTNLLMEAARRMDEWRVLSKRIPSLDRIPRFQVPEGKQGQINLNTQEWMVLSKIDGKTSIEGMAGLLGLSTFEVAKLLYGLVTMGLILLDEPPLHPVAAAPGAQEEAGLEPIPASPEEGELDRELAALLQKLKAEAESFLGETGWPVVLKAYRQAKSELEAGHGTRSVQTMCQEILAQAAQLGSPDAQRELAERFRDILASWNAGAR